MAECCADHEWTGNGMRRESYWFLKGKLGKGQDISLDGQEIDRLKSKA